MLFLYKAFHSPLFLLILACSLVQETGCMVKALARNFTKQNIATSFKLAGKTLVKHKYKTGAVVLAAGFAAAYAYRYMCRKNARVHVLNRARALNARFDEFSKRAQELPEKISFQVKNEAALAKNYQEIKQAMLCVYQPAKKHYSLKSVLACIHKDFISISRSRDMHSSVMLFFENSETYLESVEAFLRLAQEMLDYQKQVNRPEKDQNLPQMQAVNRQVVQKVQEFERSLQLLLERIKQQHLAVQISGASLVLEHLSKDFIEKLQRKLAYATACKTGNLNTLESIRGLVNYAFREEIQEPECISRLCAIMAHNQQIFRA